jgi:hypothetical protein
LLKKNEQPTALKDNWRRWLWVPAQGWDDTNLERNTTQKSHSHGA